VRTLLAWVLGASALLAVAAEHPMEFEATAYSDHGMTASGTQTRKGVLAADPRVLPLGSRIRVSRAGAYSGEYLVRDTGRKIDGRMVDIFVPDERKAKRFGRRHVQVEVLRRGEGDGSATSGRR
jgi:peptidoglycan lytic transglycosylase